MSAEIRITISSSNAGGGIAEATKDVEQLGKTAKESGGGFSAMREIAVGALREIGSIAVNALGSAAGAVKGFISDGIDAARETAKLNAQTEAVLKSTGNAAGVTAQHISDYASALSDAAGKSLFGDDQIQQSENMLLTFTNIKGTVLDAATAISVDMAQALGGAPKDNAIQLGKALNDPIKGVTALTRVGVTFSQDQKDMIQAMVETGDVAGAQGIILAELNKEFGGSAEAAAKADGGMAQFKARLGEAGEAIGTALLPLLGQFAGFLNDTVAPAVENAVALFSAWLADPATQAGIQALTTAIQTGLNTALTFLTQTALPALQAGWAAIQPAIQAVLPVVAAVVAAFTSANDTTLSLGKVLQDVGLIWTAYRALVEAEMAAVWQVIQAVLSQIMIFWQAHGTEIMAFAQTTWDTIVQIVTLALELLQATIIPLLQGIATFISQHSTEIQTILTVAWNTIKVIVSTALALIKGVIQTALQLIHGDWAGAWNTIKQTCQTIVQAIWQLLVLNFQLITGLFHTTWDGIKAYFQGIMDSIVGWVIQTFEGIKNAIVSSAGKLRSAAGGVADAIVSGIAGGISDGASKIISAAKDAAMAALNAAKSALGISSPSKVFANLVGKPMAEGMAVGLAGGAPMVAGAGAYAAGAAVAGAQTYNSRALSYSPTINNYGPASDGMDFATANSLAGV